MLTLGSIGLLYSFGSHYFHKAEHLIRSLVGILPFTLWQFMLGLKILAPKLCDLKTALVDVKVNVALFKIGRAAEADPAMDGT